MYPPLLVGKWTGREFAGATLGYAAVSLKTYVYWWETAYCVQGKIRLYVDCDFTIDERRSHVCCGEDRTYGKDF